MAGGRGSGREVDGHSVAEGSAHEKETGKLFEFLAKRNQESQSHQGVSLPLKWELGGAYWRWPEQPLGAKLGV